MPIRPIPATSHVLPLAASRLPGAKKRVPQGPFVPSQVHGRGPDEGGGTDTPAPVANQEVVSRRLDEERRRHSAHDERFAVASQIQQHRIRPEKLPMSFGDVLVFIGTFRAVLGSGDQGSIRTFLAAMPASIMCNDARVLADITASLESLRLQAMALLSNRS